MLGLGRSPGGGHGNPLQYSCLENPMDRGTWWATSIGSQSVGQDLIFRSPFHLKPLIYRDGFPGSQNEFRSPQLGIWLPLWSPVHQPDSVLFRKWSEDSRQCPDFCNQPLNDSKSSSHFLCSPLFLYLSTYKCFFRSSFEKRFPLDFKFLFYFLISF